VKKGEEYRFSPFVEEVAARRLLYKVGFSSKEEVQRVCNDLHAVKRQGKVG